MWWDSSFHIVDSVSLFECATHRSVFSDTNMIVHKAYINEFILSIKIHN